MHQRPLGLKCPGFTPLQDKGSEITPQNEDWLEQLPFCNKYKKMKSCFKTSVVLVLIFDLNTGSLDNHITDLIKMACCSF